MSRFHWVIGKVDGTQIMPHLRNPFGNTCPVMGDLKDPMKSRMCNVEFILKALQMKHQYESEKVIVFDSRADSHEL